MIAASPLHTDRLLLRRPEAGDLPAYTDYCASDRARFVGGPFTAARAFEKFAAMAGHWALRGYGRYVIVRDETPLGHAGPQALAGDQPPELTWTLWDARFEGQGIATEAAAAVAAHLLGVLGWPELRIHIDPANAASHRVAERLGARAAADATPPPWLPGARTCRLLRERAA